MQDTTLYLLVIYITLLLRFLYNRLSDCPYFDLENSGSGLIMCFCRISFHLGHLMFFMIELGLQNFRGKTQSTKCHSYSICQGTPSHDLPLLMWLNFISCLREHCLLSPTVKYLTSFYGSSP